mmetsp:Transcript_75366/g.157052  ORF Transcript_75366/g.157052 Transcript_75366/m.157052 type:complete len:504 (+) Transcript_75366:195-1706(+)|eukprot:CAMPEP_0206471790 /NCGR_PEP_ID=MMETSP0324_2-20121206/31786_1 /ASSEMBLY_ACC=CAM_ASM_000836 /TAXON_ID=2866 /ORGANISM="Crypthecodinium cohnii, Strain Seligo" /LENGTH=503 /DNA_ID=CAMNT_0053946209 /DNA_START=135 /DNA_END=1646 /DNA_ORIENTATION=+
MPTSFSSGLLDETQMQKETYHHLHQSVPEDDDFHLAAVREEEGLEEDAAPVPTTKSGNLGLSTAEEDSGFIESIRTRTFIGIVIVSDLFCLGAEADHPGGFWAWIEVALVCFYTLEMGCRIWAYGFQMFVPNDWVLGRDFRTKTPIALLNIFLLLLVIFGLVDCYVWLFDVLKLRALFMYLRLLRVIRIFHLFDVLTKFIVALLYMTQSLSWIFSVIALVSYVSAVFFTLYVQDNELHDAQEYFPDVWTSAFSLFQVTTMDNWHHIAVPLVRFHGAWGVFFVVFIAFTSWTMISLLTAFVSEQIILATRDMKVREHEAVEQRHKDFVQFLRKCFQHADSDGNGVLDKAEFTELIQEEIVTRKMEDLGVIIQHEELQDTFDMLDVDESGELTIDEFTLGLSQLQQSLGIKHVLSINYAIQRIHRKLHKQIDASGKEIDTKMDEISGKMDTFAQNLMTKEEVAQRMDRLEKLMENVRGRGTYPTPAGAAAAGASGFFNKVLDKKK